jgi:O-antigen/teichoic acid export membrane protein
MRSQLRFPALFLSKRLLRNIFNLSLGELGARVMHILAIMILARRLGSESFGYFILATTVTTYLSLLVQQGLDTIAVRWISQQQFNLSEVVASILGFRLMVATMLTVGLFLYAFIFAPHDDFNLILVIMSVLYFTNALSLRWPFLTSEKMTHPAVASFISQLCFFLGALLVVNSLQAPFAAFAQVAGEVLATLYLWLAFNARGGHVRPAMNILLIRWLLLETWPIFVSLLLGTMMYNFDLIALRLMNRTAEIGVYAATYRCITVFSPILVAIQWSIYPEFSRAWPDFSRIRRAAINLSLISSVTFGSAGLLLYALAGPLLVMLYGEEFRSGAQYLQVLSWILPIQGLRTILRQIVLASRQQRADTVNLAAAASTNVLFDVLLIPRYGALGCAVSSLAAELMFLFACSRSAYAVFGLKRHDDLPRKQNAGRRQPSA